MRKYFKEYNIYLKEHMGNWGLSGDYGINSAGSKEPEDPSLSFNSYDRFQNTIKNQIRRASDILKIMPDLMFKSKNDDFQHDFEDLTIIKMIENKNMDLDIYFKYFYDNKQEYGIIKNYTSKIEFTTTIIKRDEFLYSNDKILRLKNMILHTIREWFAPKVNYKYRLLKDLSIKNYLGTYDKLDKGALVNVVFVSKNDKPYVTISYNDKEFKIDGVLYYYFNWTFKIDDKKTFYL